MGTQATDGAQQPQDVPSAQRGEAAKLCKEYNQYRVSFDQVPNWQQLVVQEYDRLFEWASSLEARIDRTPDDPMDSGLLYEVGAIVTTLPKIKEDWLKKIQEGQSAVPADPDDPSDRQVFDQYGLRDLTPTR